MKLENNPKVIIVLERVNFAQGSQKRPACLSLKSNNEFDKKEKVVAIATVVSQTRTRTSAVYKNETGQDEQDKNKETKMV